MKDVLYLQFNGGVRLRYTGCVRGMTPAEMLDCSSKFRGVVRVDVRDLGSCTDKVLEGREGIVSGLARNRIDSFPTGIPVIDDDGIFVTEQTLALFGVTDQVVCGQRFSKLCGLWSMVLEATMRTSEHFALLASIAIWVLRLVVSQME